MLKCSHTGKLLNLWKTKTKTIMAFLQLSRQKWVEMWVKRRHEVIDYNMHDLFIPSCEIIKCSMCVIRHSRSYDCQGATETLQRHLWAELPHKENANPPYWRLVQPATFQLLFWLKQMALTVIQNRSGSNDPVQLRWLLTEIKTKQNKNTKNTTAKTD